MKMKAIEVFRKMISISVFYDMFRRGAYKNKPGAVNQKLTEEERQVLQDITADEINSEFPIQDVNKDKFIGSDIEWQNKNFQEKFSEEKMEFDKKIKK